MITILIISSLTLAILISFTLTLSLYKKLENQRIETTKLVREIALLKKK